MNFTNNSLGTESSNVSSQVRQSKLKVVNFITPGWLIRFTLSLLIHKKPLIVLFRRREKAMMLLSLVAWQIPNPAATLRPSKTSWRRITTARSTTRQGERVLPRALVPLPSPFFVSSQLCLEGGEVQWRPFHLTRPTTTAVGETTELMQHVPRDTSSRSRPVTGVTT